MAPELHVIPLASMRSFETSRPMIWYLETRWSASKDWHAYIADWPRKKRVICKSYMVGSLVGRIGQIESRQFDFPLVHGSHWSHVIHRTAAKSAIWKATLQHTPNALLIQMTRPV